MWFPRSMKRDPHSELRDSALARAPIRSDGPSTPFPTGATALDPEAWFITLRWVAVVVALSLGFLAVHVFEFLSAVAWPRILGTVSLLSILNIVYWVHARVNPGRRQALVVQASMDLVLLMALVHFSGGVENPLVLLMLFHVIIAGITLPKKHCYGIAAFALFLAALLAWGEASGLLEHYTLRLVPHYEQHGETAHAAFDALYVTGFVGLQGVILFLTAYFITSLADRLRAREADLADSARRARTQRQLLERSLETAETALSVVDRELRSVLVNGRWLDWSDEFSSDDELGPLFSGDNDLAQATLETGEVQVREYSSTPKVGAGNSSTTLLATSAPLLNEDGEPIHVVQLVRDITDQKSSERRMIRAGQLAAVGELAGQVAHEVNNPIAIISAKTQILLDDHAGSLSEKVQTELMKIVGLSDRVSDIASGLLSYARPSGALKGKINMTIPVRNALSMIEQRAGSAGIELADTLPDSLPPIHVNQTEVEQVFLNLFLNAFDAMPSGGRLTIGSDTATSGKTTMVQVMVQDNGKGIPAEVAHRVFEPFFTTKPEGRGTGLGLAICQGLVTYNDGTIDVSPVAGGGTVATVAFPIVRE